MINYATEYKKAIDILLDWEKQDKIEKWIINGWSNEVVIDGFAFELEWLLQNSEQAMKEMEENR